MSLSKPSKIAYNLLGSYFEALFNNPLRTKSFTSCLIAVLGNATSQQLFGKAKLINQDSLIAFGLFGLVFGGSVPHFFYQFLDQIIPQRDNLTLVIRLLIERLLYAPFFQVLSLYSLARFEGKTHSEAYDQMNKLYWPVLNANWKYLSLFQFLNLSVVPPILRVLFINIIGFFWSIFLARKRDQETKSVVS